MKSNKKIYIATGLMAVAVLSGCNDDEFLEEHPKTIYTAETAFSSRSQVQAQITSAYAKVAAISNPGTAGIFDEVMYAGQMLCGYGADAVETFGSDAYSGTAFSNYNLLSPLSTQFLAVWNQLYKVASCANMALYGAELISYNEADKASDVAEARFFRGWSYLRLAELFGGVPIVDKYSEELKFDYARATRTETYEFAIADLEAAAAGLPETPKETGRLSKSAAKHFLAEAYLGIGVETGTKDYYQKALDAASYVIDKHPIMLERFGARADASDTGTNDLGTPNYRADGNVFFDLFQRGNYDNPANTEAIWTFSQPTYSQYAANGGVLYTYILLGCVYRSVVSAATDAKGAYIMPWEGNLSYEVGGGDWGFINSTHYFDFDCWKDGFDDMRNSQVCLTDPIVSNPNHPKYGKTLTLDDMAPQSRSEYSKMSCKVKSPDGWNYSNPHQAYGSPYGFMYGVGWYGARSAETYLLKAEAEWRLGQSGAAAESINAVRRRAKATRMYSADEINMYTILDERVRELTFEECRWATLLRLAKQGEDNTILHFQLKNHAQFLVDNPKYTYVPTWNLFPIPTDIIQLNTDATLEQNAGWN